MGKGGGTTPGNLPAADPQELIDSDPSPVRWPDANAWPNGWDFAGGAEAIKAQIDQAAPSHEELAWKLAQVLAIFGSFDTAKRGHSLLQASAVNKRHSKPGGTRDQQAKVIAAWGDGSRWVDRKSPTGNKMKCARWCGENILGMTAERAEKLIKAHKRGLQGGR